MILGFLVHAAAFFLTFLNLPDDAPFGDTADSAYISSSKYIAMVGSVLLGEEEEEEEEDEEEQQEEFIS